MSPLRDEVIAEFKRLEEDCLYTEKTHFAASEQFKALHYILGGLAAVAAAATAISALDKHSGLSAALSIIAAVAAALVTFVKPQALADRHVASGRQLGNLRFRLRQARLLDAHNDSGLSDGELRQIAARFTVEKQELLEDAPNTGPISFWRGKRKIDKGHFEYEVGNSPTGSVDA